jgi:hypothetical protein
MENAPLSADSLDQKQCFRGDLYSVQPTVVEGSPDLGNSARIALGARLVCLEAGPWMAMVPACIASDRGYREPNNTIGLRKS